MLGGDVFELFLAKHNHLALAQQNRTGFAFKPFTAALTIFSFVFRFNVMPLKG